MRYRRMAASWRGEDPCELAKTIAAAKLSARALGALGLAPDPPFDVVEFKDIAHVRRYHNIEGKAAGTEVRIGSTRVRVPLADSLAMIRDDTEDTRRKRSRNEELVPVPGLLATGKGGSGPPSWMPRAEAEALGLL